MQNLIDETLRRMRDPEYMRAYRRRQFMKLIAVLIVIFVIPGAVIGTAALYLALFEPAEFRKAIGTPPSANPLDDLSNPSDFKREKALRALIKGPADRNQLEVAAKLRPMLSDPNPNLQSLAIEALGYWGQPEDAEAIIQRIKSMHPNLVPEFMFTTLGRLGGKEASEELARHLGNSWLREQVTKALSECGPEGETAALKYIEDSDPRTREAVCLALQSLGRAASIPGLEKATGDSDPQVAAAARQALVAASVRPEWPSQQTAE